MNRVYLKGITKFGIFSACVLSIVLFILFVDKPKEEKIESVSERIIEEKCVKCHDTQRISFLKRSPQEWEIVVRRMREKDTEWLNQEDMAACLGFLKVAYSKTGKDLFGPLCVDCHTKTDKRQLLYQRKTPEAWMRAIERMQHKYSFFIGEADSRQIIEFWTDPNNNKNLEFNFEGTDIIEGIFENKCGRCHTYKFMYGQKRTKQDWLEILDRMRKKSPSWMDEQELGQVRKYIFLHQKFLRDK